MTLSFLTSVTVSLCLALAPQSSAADTAGETGGGYAGLRLQAIPDALLSQLGIGGGALVIGVDPGSPADKAGFRRHDVVIAAGGNDVGSPTALRDAVAGKKPGEAVELDVRRGAETTRLRVELAAAPRGAARGVGARRAFLGVRYQPVPEALAAHVNMPEGAGVLVTDALDGSGAAQAGITKHDVILSVGGKPVELICKHADAPTIGLPEADLSGTFGSPAHPLGHSERCANLAQLVDVHSEGEDVDVEILRQGARKSLLVKLGPRPRNLPEELEDERFPSDFFRTGKDWSPRTRLRGKVFWRNESGDEEIIELPDLEPELDENRLPEEVRDRVKKVWEHYRPRIESTPYRSSASRRVDSSSAKTRATIKEIDADFEITVRDEDGNTTFTVKDRRSGKALAEDAGLDRLDLLPQPARDRVRRALEQVRAAGKSHGAPVRGATDDPKDDVRDPDRGDEEEGVRIIFYGPIPPSGTVEH